MKKQAYLFLKRSMDIFGALFGLIFLSPLFLAVALLVRHKLGSPVIFRQERAGKKGKPFVIYKFRTMTDERDEDGNLLPDEKRLTKFGAFLRSTSIDELPQLFNIIKGDMSLVGPRPEIPFHVDHFKHEIPYYMARHQIRPGLTGWAQVCGLRGNTSIEKRIQYDLYYIYNWSLALDIRIIVKTIFGGVFSREE